MGLLLNRRREMGGEALPYDAQIEYIGATGTQYIDTLYKPSKNSEFDIQFYWTASVSGEPDGTQQCLFGLNDGGTWANVMGNYSSSELYWAACGNVGAGLVRNQVCNVSLKGNVITRPDGATYTVSKTYSAVNRNLYLLCRNQNGPTKYCNGARIYYAKFWENGTLVRDFIPVRVGNVGYLYDKVSGQLFGNSGTGSFVPGPDVIEVEYIQNPSQAYIDTGFYYNTGHNVSYILDYTVVGSVSGQSYFGSRNNNIPNGNGWSGIPYEGRIYVGTANFGTFNSSTNTRYTLDVSISNNGTTCSFTQKSGGSTVASNSTSISTLATMNNSIVLFADQYNSGVSQYCTGIIVHSFKIIDNGTTVRDYIPVRVGNVGYLYDKVSKKLFGNAGSGSFTIGSDV